jgi:preprotein translocase subunit SecG
MSWVVSFLMVVQVVAALAIIVLVLLQQGKGADMGAAFGSGSAGSVFGSSGSANFLSRTTAIMAVVFFASTLALAQFGARDIRRPASGTGIMESIPGSSSVPAAQDQGAAANKPAQPASPADQIPKK